MLTFESEQRIIAALGRIATAIDCLRLPVGCSGCIDDSGAIVHDGATCPIHEAEGV